MREFLCGHFLRHYRRHRLEVGQPQQREWMRQELDGRTRRPLFYASNEAAREACRTPPFGLFASAATYDLRGVVAYEDLGDPRGVEVALDIDCKPGPPPLGDGYADLADAFLAARRQAQEALAVLRRDFRAKDEELTLRFSGGKGYHIILTSPRWQELGRNARIELLSVLTAANTRPALLFPPAATLPTAGDEGGAARHAWESLAALHAACRRPVVTPRLQHLLRHHSPDQDLLSSLRDASSPSDVLREHPIWWPALLACAHHFNGPLVDGGVLTDLRRLLRVPGSINGKTGLLCKALKPEELPDFEPFTDANPHSRAGSIPVVGERSGALTVGDETFTVRPAALLEVPPCVAVPWVAQGIALPVEPTAPPG